MTDRMEATLHEISLHFAHDDGELLSEFGKTELLLRDVHFAVSESPDPDALNLLAGLMSRWIHLLEDTGQGVAVERNRKRYSSLLLQISILEGCGNANSHWAA